VSYFPHLSAEQRHEHGNALYAAQRLASGVPLAGSIDGTDDGTERA